jgi:hypothetical protein
MRMVINQYADGDKYAVETARTHATNGRAKAVARVSHHYTWLGSGL